MYAINNMCTPLTRILLFFFWRCQVRLQCNFYTNHFLTSWNIEMGLIEGEGDEKTQLSSSSSFSVSMEKLINLRQKREEVEATTEMFQLFMANKKYFFSNEKPNKRRERKRERVFDRIWFYCNLILFPIFFCFLSTKQFPLWFISSFGFFFFKFYFT